MAQKVTLNIEAKTKSAKKEVEDLRKEIAKTKETTKDASDAFSGATSQIDKLTGGAITKFKNLKGTLGGVIKGFKSMRVAIIGTGIGALLIAVTSLAAAFTSSEEGQNKFSKILGIIGTITGNLVDLLADLGEKIISIFENPKQAWEDFKKAILDNLKNRFEGLLELIPALGKSIKLLFQGEFAEAGKVAVNAAAKITLGVENITDKIGDAIEATKEFIQENLREAEIAAKIADMRAKADKQERDLLIQRAEANRKVAELREQAADKENVSAEKRIESLREAGRIEEQITNQEIENARLRYEAKRQENELSKSTKEELNEEAQLKARLIELETARLRKQKALTAEITTAQRELNAAVDAEAKSREQLLKDIDVAIALEQDQKRALELQKTKEHYDNLIELAKQNGIDTFELEYAKGLALQNQQKKFDDEDLEAKAKLDKEKLDSKQAAIEAEVAIEQQKLALLSQFGGVLQQLAGENKNIQKAAVIAQQAASIGQIISATGLANAKAVAALPLSAGQPFVGINTASAGLSIASSVAAAAKAISQINNSDSGSIANGSVRGVSSSAPSTPPSFNVVGSSQTSTLANAIGGKLNTPMKAYVVSKDISTAQELDRNKVQDASL